MKEVEPIREPPSDDDEAFARKLQGLSVAIVTHTFTTGQAQEFFGYLRDKVEAVALVGHPLWPYSRRLRSEAELVYKGDRVSSFRSPPISGPLPLLLLRDLLFTLYAFLRFRRRFDLYYGANNFNAVIGVLLRRLGVVRKVIFNTVDYVPHRFKSSLLNRLYHRADHYACYHSDYVWNLSEAMRQGRVQSGLSLERSAPQMVVPIGCRFAEIPRLPLSKIKRHTVAFMGHLVEDQGVELLLDIWPRVLAQVPQAELEIVGTGPLLARLKEKAVGGNLQESVTFHGYVPDHREVERILCRCSIGVAPYVPDPRSFKWYADPGKPKQYMACGLPVVTTNVTPVSKEIAERGAGLVVEYDPDAVASALVRLLTDDKEYAEAREKAVRFASEYDWSRVFQRALMQVL